MEKKKDVQLDFKEVLKDFGENTTLHGCGRIEKYNKQKHLKYFWTILLLSAVILYIYMATVSTVEYFK